MGVVGRSGSGKTTLIESLVPMLREQGLSVSTVKHTHHGVDLDRPGKDSFRHRTAGAAEVMLVSDQRWVLMREDPVSLDCPRDVTPLLARMAPVDLVLIEGFHASCPIAFEVWRPETGKPPLFPDWPNVAAVAAPLDTVLPPTGDDVARRLRLDLNDAAAIARFVMSRAVPV